MSRLETLIDYLLKEDPQYSEMEIPSDLQGKRDLFVPCATCVGRNPSARQLASCYRSIMQLADENHLESIAFCCISTGEFRFPNQLAAEIAVQTVKDYLTEHPDSSLKQVVFNVFKDIDRDIYQQLL